MTSMTLALLVSGDPRGNMKHKPADDTCFHPSLQQLRALPSAGTASRKGKRLSRAFFAPCSRWNSVHFVLPVFRKAKTYSDDCLGENRLPSSRPREILSCSCPPCSSCNVPRAGRFFVVK